MDFLFSSKPGSNLLVDAHQNFPYTISFVFYSSNFDLGGMIVWVCVSCSKWLRESSGNAGFQTRLQFFILFIIPVLEFDLGITKFFFFECLIPCMLPTHTCNFLLYTLMLFFPNHFTFLYVLVGNWYSRLLYAFSHSPIPLSHHPLFNFILFSEFSAYLFLLYLPAQTRVNSPMVCQA